MSFRQTLLSGVGILSAVLGLTVASPAKAAPVYIGIQVGNGAIVNETNIAIPSGNGGNGTASFVGNVSGVGGTTFNLNVGATGTPFLPEPTLFSDSITVSSTGAGTVSIYVSELNQFPLNINGFLSGFTHNLTYGGNATVTESTYASACGGSGPCGTVTGNDIFDMTNLLSTTTFTSNGAVSAFANVPSSLTAPYATTELYTITFTGSGPSSVTDTINLQSVPEPASLALLGVGMISLGAIRRRRSSKHTAC